MPNVFDKQGKPISLGAELGRGGEGAVYEVTGRPEMVAKIYHKPLPPEKAQKITVMASLQSERLLNIAAWPMDTIHNKPGEPVCGLLMPKAGGYKEVHTLYGPKSRLMHFPNATWPFLIHAAMNIARAFAVMHEQGHVVGDVNQSNIYVSEKAVVKLIDCDSFQIVQNGRSYLCEVGVPTHTPPELQNKPFHGVTRTPNHDNFGLAVVIFQLLFMGRHPFSGQYLGPGEMSIEKAILESRFAYGAGAAARQMKSPPATLPLASVSSQIGSYFEQAFTSNGMIPGGRPPAQDWAVALNALVKSVKVCERQSGHHYLSQLNSCPLCELEMRSGVTLFYAVSTGVIGKNNFFDLEAVWAQIIAVVHPGPLPNLPTLPPFSPPLPFVAAKPLPPLVKPSMKVMPAANAPVKAIIDTATPFARQGRLSRRWLVIAIVAIVGFVSFTLTASTFVTLYSMVLVFVLAYTLILVTFNRKIQAQVEEATKFANERYEVQLAAYNNWHNAELTNCKKIYQVESKRYEAEVAARFLEEQQQAERTKKYSDKRRNLEFALDAVEKRYAEAKKRWDEGASSQLFDARITTLKEAKKQIQDLTLEQQKRHEKLEKDGIKRQMETYLDRFKIQSAYIEGVGQGRKATLQSYGVETAADVSARTILNIPGFGPSLSNSLLAWRRGHESRFVYNSSLGVSPADKLALEREFGARRLKPEQELRVGSSSLQMIKQNINDRRKILFPDLEASREALIKVRNDYQSLKQEV